MWYGKSRVGLAHLRDADFAFVPAADERFNSGGGKMLPMAKDTKYLTICRELTDDIGGGTLRPGDKLPTERELAERFGVHRMTVRQATDTLVKRGLVEKRLPRGVFVRKSAEPRATLARLNLICPAHDSAHSSLFMEYGIARARQRGVRARVIRVYPGDEHLAADAIRTGEPSIVLGHDLRPNSELYREMRRAGGKAVALGVRVDHAGIPCVQGDDALGIRLAIDHLWEQGHRRIGLVTAVARRDVSLHEILVHFFLDAVRSHRGGPGDAAGYDSLVGAAGGGASRRGGDGSARASQRPSQRAARAAEGAAGAEDDPDAPVIRLAPVPVGGTRVSAYEQVKRYLAATPEPVTALFCLSENVADGAAAALHHQGLSVPDDVSLLSYAGTYHSAIAVPPRSAIDVSIKQHVDDALEMIDAASGEPAGGHKTPPADDALVRMVKPRLVRRETVAPPRPNRGAGGGHSELKGVPGPSRRPPRHLLEV